MATQRHRKTLNIPGHAHELTFSCYKRYPFLMRDRTRGWLGDAIDNAKQKDDFAVWSYVVMPEHVHLLIFPRQQQHDVSTMMAAIKEPVGRRAIQYLQRQSPQWLTKLTRKRGRRTERLFWQSGGGYDRNIDQPATLWKVIRYIHENPVRRGLSPRAVDWIWSSARWHDSRTAGPIAVDPVDW